MRILVTGASGQVGRALCETVGHDHTMIRTIHATDPGRPDAVPFSLADPVIIQAAVAESRPDWIIHAAAMSGVDACERDPARAQVLNSEAAGHLALAAAQHGARLLYVSTDYIFDGEAGPYREEDPTGPVNAYGRSKLAGEEAVKAVLGREAVIARTCVVFGPHGASFVTWCIDQLSQGNNITIAEDQVVSPTYSRDLADQLLALVEAGATGTYHTAGATRLTRLAMAETVAELFNLDPSPIIPCRRVDLPWEAPRPRDTSLDTSKMAGIKAPWGFREALGILGRERSEIFPLPTGD